MNVSILLPSKQKRQLYQILKETKDISDEIIIFNVGVYQITDVINRMVMKAKNDYIILVDPQATTVDIKAIKKIAPNAYVNNDQNIIGFLKSKFSKINRNHLTYKSYQDNVLDTLDNVNFNKFSWSKISIIIPFMFNGDRWPLFKASIKNLYELTKDDNDIEIVIHETGTKQHLKNYWLKKYNIKYEFTQWTDVFHRGWSLNYAAKNIATGDLFVFMDGDLFVDKQWINLVKKCDTVYIGWSEMINLNKNGTDKMLKNGISTFIEQSDVERIRKPSANAAAGGINIYPKTIFYEMRGWCEEYYGTYGGEDNSTFLKLQSLGYKIKILNAKVYHLYHSHATFKHPKRFKIFETHKKFSKERWKQYINNISISEWGSDGVCKIHDYDKKLKILWCKIDTTKRVAKHYDDLLESLNKKCHIDILVQDLQGEHPATFQKKCLALDIKRPYMVYEKAIANNYDFIICANMFAFNHEPWHLINTPKAALLEDQHGENNLQQVKDMIKDKWLVLHRYQLKKFHTDLPIYTECIWFPHSVNIKTFRDFKQKKVYDILQTGALYNVYQTRNFVLETLKYDPRYTQIPRPKENDENQWPIGRDYSKELNKAYLNVCCGSIYQYPVMKYLEIPASNSVIFGDYFDELKDLGFVPYKNMIEIDKNNLHLQLKLLLDQKDKLVDIAQNGYNLIHERHTNDIRASQLIDIMTNYINKRK